MVITNYQLFCSEMTKQITVLENCKLVHSHQIWIFSYTTTLNTYVLIGDDLPVGACVHSILLPDIASDASGGRGPTPMNIISYKT